MFSATGDAWQLPVRIGPRYGLAAVNDPVHALVMMFGGRTSGALPYPAETWILGQRGFEQDPRPSPTGRQNYALAWDPLRAQALMFGGGKEVPFTIGNETWIWTLAGGWIQATGSTAPPPRMNAAMAFDGEHVVLFGGQRLNSSLGDLEDTWVWDGATWTAVTGTHPAARRGAAMAYDPQHAQAVLFGGSIDNAPVDDTWTFSGSAWTQVNLASSRPFARAFATLTWQPARRKLLLAGGEASVDASEWDGTAWHTVPAQGAPDHLTHHAAFASIDGSGVMLYGNDVSVIDREFYELRWDGPRGSESCATGADDDGDGLVACDDGDCWAICTPLCPPATSCDPTTPSCGDGTCEPRRETTATCPADCP
ncbi:MAG: hypothetical protein NT062_32015 [Proteobacteria bacterium]|nr:hypothetical protein [Pseudomonadota bacterium]